MLTEVLPEEARITYDVCENTAARALVSWVGILENRAFAEKMRPFLEAANEQNLDRLAREVSTGTKEGR